MEFIADTLLIAGACAAAFYCIILSRRLKKFNDLEKGVGGAIAVFSTQVDDMTKILDKAQTAATGSTDSLQILTSRAEDVAKRLEILVASMHDLPGIVEAQVTDDGLVGSRPQSGSNEKAVKQNTQGEKKTSESTFRSARQATSEAA